MARRLVVAAIAICLPLGAKAPKRPCPWSPTSGWNSPAGGAIEVTGSVGELNIEGWDGPGRPDYGHAFHLWRDTPRDRDVAQRRLSAIKGDRGEQGARRFHPHRHSGAAVFGPKCAAPAQRSTGLPHPRAARFQPGAAPRERRRAGVRCGGRHRRFREQGDIVLQLAGAGAYAFDAQLRFGRHLLRLHGQYRTGIWWASASRKAAGARQAVRLRVGVGASRFRRRLWRRCKAASINTGIN